MILFKMNADGGFLCGDTRTGFTAYAYPTSEHATKARKSPAKVAGEMVAAANQHSPACNRLCPELAERDAKWLAKLHAGADGFIGTVTASTASNGELV